MRNTIKRTSQWSIGYNGKIEVFLMISGSLSKNLNVEVILISEFMISEIKDHFTLEHVEMIPISEFLST